MSETYYSSTLLHVFARDSYINANVERRPNIQTRALKYLLISIDLPLQTISLAATVLYHSASFFPLCRRNFKKKNFLVKSVTVRESTTNVNGKWLRAKRKKGEHEFETVGDTLNNHDIFKFQTLNSNLVILSILDIKFDKNDTFSNIIEYTHIFHHRYWKDNKFTRSNCFIPNDCNK